MVRGLAMAALLVGCSGDSKEEQECGEPNMKLTDANNYSFTSDFTIGQIPVAPQSELTIDWSQVSLDIRGRAVDPTQIDQMLAVRFQLTQAEVLQKIDDSSLEAADADLQYLFFPNGASSTPVSTFSIIGNPMDISELQDDSSVSWLITAADNRVPNGLDFLINTFIVPTTGETNTLVELNNDSATLAFDVDLQTASPLVTTPSGPLTVDWSGAQNDAYGRPLDLNLVNNLVIGHVAAEDLNDVEGLFLRLYEEADQVYDLDVNALTSADLTQAVSRIDGTQFSGFTTDGTWVVAIECTRSECTNPAPLLLAVVEVCE